MALANKLDADIIKILTQIQNDLFVVGADLSKPNLLQKENRVTPLMVTGIEKAIDRCSYNPQCTVS